MDYFKPKKIYLVLFILCFWLSANSKAVADSYPVNVNLPLLSTNGHYLHTSDFRNQLLFITIFQNDCEYCQEEVHDIDELYDTPLIRKWYVFMGVDPYDSINTIKLFGNAYGVEYPLYQSNLSDVYSQLHITFTPVSVILLNGRVIGVFYGKHSYLTMKHALEEIINQILIFANQKK